MGAMVLSRSMTIAFLPGFLVAAIIQVLVSGRRFRALSGVGLGGAAGFVIAGPWYLAQGASVWAYLSSFGFGSQSALYGPARSPLSLASWRLFVRINVDAYLWLPLSLVIAAGGVVLVTAGIAAVRGAWPGHLRSVLSYPWLSLSVIVGGGLVALESSRNSGSGFLLPLTPLMLALAVGALFRWVGRRAWQAGVITAAAILVGASVWTAKTALNGPMGADVSVPLPGIGGTTLVDGRSAFDLYAAGQVDATDAEGKNWAQASRTLVGRIRQLTPPAGQAPLVVFATNDRMLNINTFRLEQALDGGRELDARLLSASTGNGPLNYVAPLRAAPGRDILLIVRVASAGEFAPVVNPTSVLQAAESLKFHQVESMLLPDGTSLAVWQR